MINHVVSDRSDAFWREDLSSRQIAGREKWSYLVPIFKGASIYAVLGKVKQKNDKRWEWWCLDPSLSIYSKVSICGGQGVCATKEEAQQMILNGWI